MEERPPVLQQELGSERLHELHLLVTITRLGALPHVRVEGLKGLLVPHRLEGDLVRLRLDVLIDLLEQLLDQSLEGVERV